MYKIIKEDKDDKLTKDLSLLLNRIFPHFSSDEKEEFFIEMVRTVNIQWVEDQKKKQTLVRVEYNVIYLLSRLISQS